MQRRSATPRIRTLTLAHIDPDIRQQHGYEAASRLWPNRGMVGLESRPPGDLLGTFSESNSLTDG